ncbi:MAG TPA: DUF177 domain-containing protein [Acidimicrobiales bacterium]
MASDSDRAGRPPNRSDKRPFIIPAAKLGRVAGTVRRELRQAPIEDLATMGSAVPQGAEVSVAVTLSSYPGGVMASGTVEAPWTGECRRCGSPVAGEVRTEVRERYVAEGGTDVDDEAYPLANDELDLEPLARDAVLLELPLAPLCAPDCQGLCPQCGINRNEEECTCEQPVDPRWSALDALRDEGSAGEA